GADVDGEIGPQTIGATAAYDPATLIKQISDERLTFLQGLSTWGTFGRGWTRRVQGVRSAALDMATAAGPVVVAGPVAGPVVAGPVVAGPVVAPPVQPSPVQPPPVQPPPVQPPPVQPPPIQPPPVQPPPTDQRPPPADPVLADILKRLRDLEAGMTGAAP